MFHNYLITTFYELISNSFSLNLSISPKHLQISLYYNAQSVSFGHIFTYSVSHPNLFAQLIREFYGLWSALLLSSAKDKKSEVSDPDVLDIPGPALRLARSTPNRKCYSTRLSSSQGLFRVLAKFWYEKFKNSSLTLLFFSYFWLCDFRPGVGNLRPEVGTVLF